MKNTETAATTGLISYFSEVNICTGSVVILPVVRNNAMMNSPKELIKAKRAPTKTPTLIRGAVTRKKALIGPAPRFLAASSREGSIPWRTEDTMRYT